MTPKEKAKELFNKFYSFEFSMDEEDAKKCALIAVDEIIKLQCCGCMECGGLDIEYWQDVKKEIQKL